METYHLPFDLITDVQRTDQSVLIRPYQAGRTTVNNKIVLQHHMINLLLTGTKTVMHAEEKTTISAGEFLILSAGNILTSEMLSQDDTFASITIYFPNLILTDFFSQI